MGTRTSSRDGAGSARCVPLTPGTLSSASHEHQGGAGRRGGVSRSLQTRDRKEGLGKIKNNQDLARAFPAPALGRPGCVPCCGRARPPQSRGAAETHRGAAAPAAPEVSPAPRPIQARLRDRPIPLGGRRGEGQASAGRASVASTRGFDESPLCCLPQGVAPPRLGWRKGPGT